jgi:hypothetical protein
MSHSTKPDMALRAAQFAQPSAASLWAGALVTFAVVFAYRWLTVNFTNDQFVPLSRARQILLGDLPVRDFFDPGLFLQHYASAAALYLSGGTLLGEAVLTIFFISLGSALVYVMATRLSRSWVVGAAATATAVATFPRLYNYPKVFLFVLAVVCAWRYRARPTTINLSLLAVATAIAFLFRYDLGAYVGVAVTAFLIAMHWPASAARMRPLGTALGLYVGTTMLLVLPFLVFIQFVAGIPRYLSGLTSQARDVTTLRLNAPPLRFDWTQPLIHIDPPSEARIHVRWASDISNDVRRDRERQYGLSRPMNAEGTTWSYVATHTDTRNIARLLADPLVDDTNGIDRERAEVALRESSFRRAQRWIPFLRMHIAPGIVTTNNAIAWLYYVTLALPAVAAMTLIGLRWNNRPSADREGDLPVAVMLIVLCAVVGQSLVREAPETRLPDVAAPMAVLGAWLTGAWAGGEGRRRRAGVAATLAFGGVALWSAAVFGELGDRVVRSGVLAGPGAVREQLAKMNEYLATRPPIDAWNDRESVALRTLAEWLRACTASSDRLLVVGWAADLYFYAERPFAGGQVYLYPDWHSSVADQELTVERLTHQRVPVAIAPVASQPVTRASFPIVLDYVDRHYMHVVRAKFGSPWEYDVLVRRDIPPVRNYEPLDLPCYRGPRP